MKGIFLLSFLLFSLPLIAQSGQDEYNNIYSEEVGGLNRIVMKKNMVDGVNTLTQFMFQDAQGNDLINTIFVIQYEFELKNQTINLPDNCVLEFAGGSIKNGVVYGINVTIIAPTKAFENITGSISLNGSAHTKWFGYKTSDINKTCALFKDVTVIVDAGKYVHDITAVIPYDITLKSDQVLIETASNAPVLSIYSEYTNIDLQDMRIIVGKSYSGSVIEFRGNGYDDIKGFIAAPKENQPFYYGIITRREYRFPLLMSEGNTNGIGLSVLTNENRQYGDRYRFTYNKFFHLSCINMGTGIFINCNGNEGSMTNNKYDLSFENCIIGIRLSQMLRPTNVFHVVYQCDSNSRKILKNDNYENDKYSEYAPTFEYLEVWDVEAVPDPDVRFSLIDNCNIMSIQREGGRFGSTFGNKYLFRLKNVAASSLKDSEYGLSDAELRCGYINVAAYPFVKDILIGSIAVNGYDVNKTIMYMANKFNDLNPTRSLRVEINAGPGFNYYPEYRALTMSETPTQGQSASFVTEQTKVIVDFMLCENNHNARYTNNNGSGITRVHKKIIGLESGHIDDFVYEMNYNNGKITSLSTLSQYKTGYINKVSSLGSLSSLTPGANLNKVEFASNLSINQVDVEKLFALNESNDYFETTDAKMYLTFKSADTCIFGSYLKIKNNGNGTYNIVLINQ